MMGPRPAAVMPARVPVAAHRPMVALPRSHRDAVPATVAVAPVDSANTVRPAALVMLVAGLSDRPAHEKGTADECYEEYLHV